MFFQNCISLWKELAKFSILKPQEKNIDASVPHVPQVIVPCTCCKIIIVYDWEMFESWNLCVISTNQSKAIAWSCWAKNCLYTVFLWKMGIQNPGSGSNRVPDHHEVHHSRTENIYGNLQSTSEFMLCPLNNVNSESRAQYGKLKVCDTCRRRCGVISSSKTSPTVQANKHFLKYIIDAALEMVEKRR